MTGKVVLFLAVILIAMAGFVYGAPAPPESSAVNPAEDEFLKQFKSFQEQSKRQFEDFERRSGYEPISEFDVKHLPKNDNTHVYGESKSYHHSYSNINGKEHEEQGGHEVINDDGKISEFDLA